MFDDVRLPTDVERGAKGGPTFATTILELAQGAEVRNQLRERAIHVYSVNYGISNFEDYTDVRDFYYARRGRARGFRFKDWGDYLANDIPILTGNGVVTTAQLVKKYTSGSETYTRKITRPVTGTLVLKDNGVAMPTGWTLGALGLITFTTAPATGHTITASFEFDVPVRFNTDQYSFIAETYNAGEIDTLEIREIME